MRIDPTLQEQLASLVAGEGMTLLATEVVGTGSKTVLRLVVDGDDGVNLDQCAAVSRQASAMLDVDDPAVHGYTLEVSSPGLDRKMYSKSDYERHTGRRVKVRMKPSYREARGVVAELVGIADSVLRLKLDSGDMIELPYNEVFETRLEVDWKSILKEGKCRQ